MFADTVYRKVPALKELTQVHNVHTTTHIVTHYVRAGRGCREFMGKSEYLLTAYDTRTSVLAPFFFIKAPWRPVCSEAQRRGITSPAHGKWRGYDSNPSHFPVPACICVLIKKKKKKISHESTDEGVITPL